MERAAATSDENPCQGCGACCAYSANWPRFSTEDDEALDRIPAEFVNARGIGHALRRRPLHGAEGQGRRNDGVLDLRRAAGGVPHLHAGRCRMRDGAEEVRIAGLILRWRMKEAYAVTASATSSSSSSSIGAKVESGLVESVIGLRPL